MSMAEYMCKLYYGRRGIKLTEEHLAIVKKLRFRAPQLSHKEMVGKETPFREVVHGEMPLREMAEKETLFKELADKEIVHRMLPEKEAQKAGYNWDANSDITLENITSFNGHFSPTKPDYPLYTSSVCGESAVRSSCREVTAPVSDCAERALELEANTASCQYEHLNDLLYGRHGYIALDGFKSRISFCICASEQCAACQYRRQCQGRRRPGELWQESFSEHWTTDLSWLATNRKDLLSNDSNLLELKEDDLNMDNRFVSRLPDLGVDDEAYAECEDNSINYTIERLRIQSKMPLPQDLLESFYDMQADSNLTNSYQLAYQGISESTGSLHSYHLPLNAASNQQQYDFMMQQMSTKQHQQQACAVCGDHAACQHYGVRTCEGCKGFFKRTVQKNAKYICLSGKLCPIDKRRRNRCQFCRFQKCLAVGMVKEVVRTNNLKGRRGRLPSKSKPRELKEPSPHPHLFIPCLVKAHVETTPQSSNLNYDYFTYEDSSSCKVDLHQLLLSILISASDCLRDFSRRMPRFSELSQQNQNLLIEQSTVEILLLKMAFSYNEDEKSVVCPNGLVLNWTSNRQTNEFCWLDEVVQLAATVCHFDLVTQSAFVALTLFSDRDGIDCENILQAIRASILEELKEHQQQIDSPSILPLSPFSLPSTEKPPISLSPVTHVLSELTSRAVNVVSLLKQLGQTLETEKLDIFTSLPFLFY